MNNIEKAKAIIAKIMYITIATVSKDGKPWNVPVYSAYDEKFNFFWNSWKENEHSQNIRSSNNIFLAIYDSTMPEGTGKGVYVKAKAYELDDPKEIEYAVKYIYGRINKVPKKAEEFLGDYPRRVYKAIHEKFWINGNDKINGNYIDTRIEVKLI